MARRISRAYRAFSVRDYTPCSHRATAGVASVPPATLTWHVRWIAPSSHDGELLLVGVELGGLMRSTDGRATWADHRPGAQRDAHSFAWHARVPRRAYEAGGGGATIS